MDRGPAAWPARRSLRSAGATRPGSVCTWQRVQPLEPAQRCGRAGVERTRFRYIATGPADQPEARDRRNVFDIALLADRLLEAVLWINGEPDVADLTLGLFGASTGAGAALMAAAEIHGRFSAVVSRGGRPDLAGHALPRVTAPTLLIVGGEDHHVITPNRQALAAMTCEKMLQIVPRAPSVRGAGDAGNRDGSCRPGSSIT